MKFLFCRRYWALGCFLVAMTLPAWGDNLGESLASFSSALATLTRQLEESRVPVPVMSAEDIVKALGEDTIIAKDTTKHIWQVRVQQQLSKECGWQGPRNCIFFGTICLSQKEGIKALYQDMLRKQSKKKDEKSYEAFASDVCKERECERDSFQNFWVGQDFFATYQPHFPPASVNLVPIMSAFSYHNQRALSGEFSAGWGEKRYTVAALKLINKVEGVSGKNEQRALDVGSMCKNRDSLLEASAMLSAPRSALRCVLFSVFTSMPHTTALIVHKYKGEYSYFFLDSLNVAFTGQANYLAALDMFKRFMENPQELLDDYLRFCVIDFEEQSTAAPLETSIFGDFFVEIQGYGLAELALWKKTYKNYVLKRLEELAEDMPKKQEKDGVAPVERERQKQALAKLIQDVKNS